MKVMSSILPIIYVFSSRFSRWFALVGQRIHGSYGYMEAPENLEHNGYKSEARARFEASYNDMGIPRTALNRWHGFGF